MRRGHYNLATAEVADAPSTLCVDECLPALPHPHMARMLAATSMGAGTGRVSPVMGAGDQFTASNLSRQLPGMNRVRMA